MIKLKTNKLNMYESQIILLISNLYISEKPKKIVTLCKLSDK